MVDEKISEWIREGLKKGYTTAELRKKLIEKGYSKKEIEKYFDKRTNLIYALIAVGIIIILIFGIIRFYPQIKELIHKKSLGKQIGSKAEIYTRNESIENAIDKGVLENALRLKNESICWMAIDSANIYSCIEEVRNLK